MRSERSGEAEKTHECFTRRNQLLAQLKAVVDESTRQAIEDGLALLGRTKVPFLIYARLPETHTRSSCSWGYEAFHATNCGPVCAAALLSPACSHSGRIGTAVAWAGPSTPAALSLYRSELAA